MCPGGIGEGSMGEAADRELGQVAGSSVPCCSLWDLAGERLACPNVTAVSHLGDVRQSNWRGERLSLACLLRHSVQGKGDVGKETGKDTSLEC